MRLLYLFFVTVLAIGLSSCATNSVPTSTLSPKVQEIVEEYNEIAADYVYGNLGHHKAYRKDVKSVVPIAHETFLKNASMKLKGIGYTSKLFRENADNPEFDYNLAITDARTDKIVSNSKDGFWHESFIYSTIVVDGEHKFRAVHRTLITTDKDTLEPELWSCVLSDIHLY